MGEKKADMLVGRYGCGCISLAVVDDERTSNKDRADFWATCAKRDLTGKHEADLKPYECDGTACKAPKRMQASRKKRDVAEKLAAYLDGTGRTPSTTREG